MKFFGIKKGVGRRDLYVCFLPLASACKEVVGIYGGGAEVYSRILYFRS
ncbi:MAG: hypothetical protein PUJ79_05740 [Helicobacter sp.]|nr:hypothetical protein [Helicobacter sp.]MDY5740807.1 hypothetical protein [Helicobacter sp.]